MPRNPRVFSSAHYQHVIVRGIGKQILFEEPADNYFFLSQLRRIAPELTISVNAICLMENHVHMLIHDPDGNMPVLMHRLCLRYAEYFNKKYERTGHLFQDRYKSEPIENERAYLAVFRYILRNPEKAGICETPDYPWSSFRTYYMKRSPFDFIDLSLPRSLIGTNASYEAFVLVDPMYKGEDDGMEFEPQRNNDDWAKTVLREKLNIASGTALQNYTREERDKALQILIKEGLSIRQIERLTGIPRGIIQHKK